LNTANIISKKYPNMFYGGSTIRRDNTLIELNQAAVNGACMASECVYGVIKCPSI